VYRYFEGENKRKFWGYGGGKSRKKDSKKTSSELRDIMRTMVEGKKEKPPKVGRAVARKGKEK